MQMPTQVVPWRAGADAGARLRRPPLAARSGREAGDDVGAVVADDEGGGVPALVAVGGEVGAGAADADEVVAVVAVDVGEFEGREVAEAADDVLAVVADDEGGGVPALVAVSGDIVVDAGGGDEVVAAVAIDVGELECGEEPEAADDGLAVVADEDLGGRSSLGCGRR